MRAGTKKVRRVKKTDRRCFYHDHSKGQSGNSENWGASIPPATRAEGIERFAPLVLRAPSSSQRYPEIASSPLRDTERQMNIVVAGCYP